MSAINISATDEVINIAQLTEKSTKITEVILNPTRIGYTGSSVAGTPIATTALLEVLASMATIGQLPPPQFTSLDRPV